MDSYTYIIIHGYRASSKTNWFPQLIQKCTELGIDFALPDLPGHREPERDVWIEMIRAEVEKSSKPVIFIGHSLGTRAILLYLEKYQPTTIHTVILVSPPANWIENGKRWDGKVFAKFFDHRIDMKKIQSLAHFVVIHAHDDHDIAQKPGLDFAHGHSLAKELNADLISPAKGGHFLSPEDFPQLWNIFVKILKIDSPKS